MDIANDGGGGICVEDIGKFCLNVKMVKNL